MRDLPADSIPHIVVVEEEINDVRWRLTEEKTGKLGVLNVVNGSPVDLVDGLQDREHHRGRMTSVRMRMRQDQDQDKAEEEDDDDDHEDDDEEEDGEDEE